MGDAAGRLGLAQEALDQLGLVEILGQQNT